MKIGISQIKGTAGDFTLLYDRVCSQLMLAEQQGIELVSFPVTTVSGVISSGLAAYSSFQSCLISFFNDVSAKLVGSSVRGLLFPVVLTIDGMPLYEVFLVKDDRIVPLRLLAASSRGSNGPASDLWAPVCFDIGGIRIGLTFDLRRDIDLLPPGCDLCLYFLSQGFKISDSLYSAGASLAEGEYSRLASRAGVWLACVSPVGLSDDYVFCGSSFVLDDAGRTVALARSFEEDLLVVEIERGGDLPSFQAVESVPYHRERQIWGALREFIFDSVSSSGFDDALILLDGGLPSYLLASLAVDALGSRHVIGLYFPTSSPATPKELAEQLDTGDSIRTFAKRLHIRYREFELSEAFGWLLRELGCDGSGFVSSGYGWIVDAMARQVGAVPLSSLTKTDYALAADVYLNREGALAPFGDLYLSSLESLARYRNSISPILPSAVFSKDRLDELASSMLVTSLERTGIDAEVLRSVVSFVTGGDASIDAFKIDRFLEEHVDQGSTIGATELGSESPAVAQMLAFIVEREEDARRRLPPYPMISSCSFAERAWPRRLSWLEPCQPCDEEAIQSLLNQEIKREHVRSEDAGRRVREEIAGLIGEFLGLDADQQKELLDFDGVPEMGLEEGERPNRASREARPAHFEDSRTSDRDEEMTSPAFRLGGPFFSLN